MTPVRCFFLTPTNRVRRSLRRYAGSATCNCPGLKGYHDESIFLDVFEGEQVCGDVWPRDDPRWPKA